MNAAKHSKHYNPLVNTGRYLTLLKQLFNMRNIAELFVSCNKIRNKQISDNFEYFIRKVLTVSPVSGWLGTSAWNPKAPGSIPSASYVQR